MAFRFLQFSLHGLFALFGGFALDAAERFFSSVIISAHNFIKPKASPYRFKYKFMWMQKNSNRLNIGFENKY